MLNKIKSFVIYQITNLLNNHIYIGAHSTYNIYDKYMGSSKYLKKDLRDLGRHNFKKDILFVFDNKEEMISKEAELVTIDFCHRIDTYNKMVGGISEMSWLGMVITKDKDNNFYSVYNNDPRYLSGELVPIAKGNTYTKNKISVKDNNGNTLSINYNDPRYLSGELIPVSKNMITVKDNNNNILHIDKTDLRYINGELVSIWKDKKHTKESIEKMRKSKENYGVGEANSMFGKTHSEESKQQTSDALARTFYVYDLDGNFISQEKNVKKYALLHNLDDKCIGKVLNGKYKTSGKKRFYYEYQGLKIEL